MNKRFRIAAIILCTLMVVTGCGSKDPHKRGVEAGKAACECYKLEGMDAVNDCLNRIEKENQELLTDTAYTNAVEAQLLECITDGVIDMDKPIKEAPMPKTNNTDTAK